MTYQINLQISFNYALFQIFFSTLLIFMVFRIPFHSVIHTPLNLRQLLLLFGMDKLTNDKYRQTRGTSTRLSVRGATATTASATDRRITRRSS